MFFVQPVVQTLGYGQLGIFLVALVALDLVPGPRVLPRRLLPEGVLTGLAAAIKLTPAIFLLYLLLAGKRRAFLVATLSAVAVTLVSAAIVPRASLDFWGRLAQGDTGLGGSIIYYTNQSVMADIVRVLGLGTGAALLGLAASAVVALVGVWAAVRWHRLGQVGLAVNLCGVAGLLASPVSWLHHFVWVVPLGVSLALAGRRGTSAAPPLDAGAGLAVRRLGRRRAARADRRHAAAAQRGRPRARVAVVRARGGRGDRGGGHRLPGRGNRGAGRPAADSSPEPVEGRMTLRSRRVQAAYGARTARRPPLAAAGREGQRG